MANLKDEKTAIAEDLVEYFLGVHESERLNCFWQLVLVTENLFSGKENARFCY